MVLAKQGIKAQVKPYVIVTPLNLQTANYK